MKILVEEGAERIEELMAWSKARRNKLSFEAENAHSASRVLHSAGELDRQGNSSRSLDKAHSLKHISVAEFTFATSLLTDAGRVTGVSLLDDKGVPHEISCSAVLVATGGCGQIYRNTTNPETATGDGIALAFRAGAEISDMEFVQFHPTALYMKKVPQFLLPETPAHGGRLPAQFRTRPLHGEIPSTGRESAAGRGLARHRA